MTSKHDYRQLERERDLLLRLLQLTRRDDVEALLAEALALMLRVAGAERGYIEAFDPDGLSEERGRWSAASALSDERIEAVRGAISRGIIAESLRRGEVIETLSAFTDPRFAAFDSVQQGEIEVVLCIPVGLERPVGVLYLEGRRGSGSFGAEVRRLADLFAAHAAPALEQVITRRRQHEPDPTAPLRARLQADTLLGRSAALARVLEQVALVAPLDISVLITGPSGSGKSEVARVIVRSGPRAHRPLIELNCATIPDELLESELFGALAGAHSTARRALHGKVHAAEGGTLFLDEISELSPRAQAKLLQLIQDKIYYPLGAASPVVADIRLIAATHRDLAAEVTEGRFREDLYHRLHVIPIALPGLAARRVDIPLLCRAFVHRTCDNLDVAPLSITPAAMSAALAARWPGHVRELKHKVEAAVIRAHGAGAAAIRVEHLFPEQDEPLSDGGPPSLYEAVRGLQRAMITDALAQTQGNVPRAAERLQVSRSHLYKLMATLGIQKTKPR